MERNSMIRKFAGPIASGLVIFAASGVALAQHDTGSGGVTGAASGGGTTASSSSRGTAVRRTPPRRTTPARTNTPPPRRGITAEQYNAQGDELFKAQNYDDALEAYQRAVTLKPIAGAYYHIGWIYNDREDYESA